LPTPVVAASPEVAVVAAVAEAVATVDVDFGPHVLPVVSLAAGLIDLPVQNAKLVENLPDWPHMPLLEPTIGLIEEVQTSIAEEAVALAMEAVSPAVECSSPHPPRTGVVDEIVAAHVPGIETFPTPVEAGPDHTPIAKLGADSN
jgi:hypothetical protein